MTTLFIADEGTTNVLRATSFASEEGSEVVFAISQSLTGSKKEGQDAISAVLRGRWECCVLCDGHDVHGHLVARGICEALAVQLLDAVEPHRLDTDEAEDAIIDAFARCEKSVMWSNQTLTSNCFVRVVAGEWEGSVGYVSEVHASDDSFSVIIIDANAYHRPRLSRQHLLGARFIGGSTCVAFIRDSVANLVRVAVMGDTRALVLRHSGAALKSDPIWEEIAPGCFLTFPHDVFNTAELVRLHQQWQGEYEIDGPYMINPLTGCEIQPTRGFGDFDMYGTGYIPVPDVSKAFALERGTIVMVASDGLFDDQVWPDFKDICSFVTQRVDRKADLIDLAEDLHAESVRRGKLTDYVDDISFFVCWAFPPHRDAPPPKAQPGVEGLPPVTPGSSFVSIGSLMPLYRDSASFSVIAASRRLSSPIGVPSAGAVRSVRASTEMLGGEASTPPSASPPRGAGRSMRASTETFDAKGPRYLNKEKSAQRKKSGFAKEHGDAIRHLRGPSFMVPEGFVGDAHAVVDMQELQAVDAEAPSSQASSPAQAVRAAVHKRRATELDVNGGGAKGHHKTVSFRLEGSNVLLARMASRFGHDPHAIETLLRDLDVV